MADGGNASALALELLCPPVGTKGGMMRKNARRLRLSRETLRRLDDDQLGRVAGGSWGDDTTIVVVDYEETPPQGAAPPPYTDRFGNGGKTSNRCSW